ncbi:hypothetical protein VTJ49DRAFT_1377 [Mycothermus thermophilus]|uniref:Uncharacterized protein n=1 Tax=Humicola insolens TaxID=85995 RepID=A0ABR3VPP6_HUMIN
MRSSALYLGAGAVLAGLANAACTPRCGSAKCLGALSQDPAAGESFCTSFLSLAPVTTTVTEVERVTSTQVGVETRFETVTVATATVTVTTGSATTIFQKRAPTITDVSDEPAPTSPVEDPELVIVSKCASDHVISKACSCFLSTVTASTVTVTETATSTDGVETTSTLISTVTENVIATVSIAPPARTIHPNVIVNSGFEDYLNTGNILPWTDTASTTGGQLHIVTTSAKVCVASDDCAGSVLVRAHPPQQGYVAIKEKFDGKPSTTYQVSFMMRCLQYDSMSRIDVYYNGEMIGSANQCHNDVAFYRPTSDVRFTTDATGRGELEIRFMNPGNTPYLYYYVDDFSAIAVEN